MTSTRRVCLELPSLPLVRTGTEVGHYYRALYSTVRSPDQVTAISPPWLADIDGIEFERDGALQLTIVGGLLVRYRDLTQYEIFGGEGVSSTNHGYSAELGLAMIPAGYDNAVIAIEISE